MAQSVEIKDLVKQLPETGMAAYANPHVMVGSGSPDGDLVPFEEAPLGTIYVNQLGGLYQKVASGDADTDWEVIVDRDEGKTVMKIARFEFDTAVVANRTIAAHGLGVTLPINAVVVGGFFRVQTAFTSAETNTGTIALSILAANDLQTAAAVSGAPYSTTGLKAIVPKSNTPESTGILLTSAKEITATVAVAALTAGRLVGVIHYVTDIV